jgi:hypothetical protein
MSRAVWVRPLLWLVPLGIAPALLIDLVGIGPEDAGVWPVLGMMAVWLGFPYYFVEGLLALLFHVRGTPPATLHVIAAALTALLLILADRGGRAFVRATARREDRGPPAASTTPQN